MKSKRAEQWEDFSKEVEGHIENYTVPQYGDMPDDQIEEFELSDFKTNIKKYVNRIGSNARGNDEAIRDAFKIAHYACVLCALLRKGQA